MDKPILLRKTDLSRNVGITTRTIFDWTKRGILKPSTKALGGNLYDLKEAERIIAFVRAAKSKGKKLSEIKKLLDKQKAKI